MKAAPEDERDSGLFIETMRRLLKRVVGESDEGILVCTEEEYAAAQREDREPRSIGWPAEFILGLVAQPQLARR